MTEREIFARDDHPTIDLNLMSIQLICLNASITVSRLPIMMQTQIWATNMRWGGMNLNSLQTCLIPIPNTTLCHNWLAHYNCLTEMWWPNLDNWKRNLARETHPTIDLILIRNQSTCIEKGKPKNNNKIRQHEKTNSSFNSPSPFPLSNPFFSQTVTIEIVIAVHPNDRQQRMRPALSPPQAARSGGRSSSNSSQSRKHLAVAACKSFPPAYAHWQLQRWIKTWSIFPPPSTLPRNEGTINNQSSLSSWPLQLLSAYTTLPPPTPHCCRRCRHAAAAIPNGLLLPLKLHFHQAAASTAMLATAAVLPPLPPLPPRCHHRATTANKIKK
jgi:hypothetical protein